MSDSTKIKLDLDTDLIDGIIKEYVMENMSNESIIVFQENLLNEVSLEFSLKQAVLNEGIITTIREVLD